MNVPTPAQVRAQVAAIRHKVPRARVIGVRAPLAVAVGATLEVAGQALPVVRSASVLEVCERLAQHEEEGEEASPLVLVTPLDEAELGVDVVARLARRRLFAVDPWQLVKDLFQARWVEPRLPERHPWVARAVLDAAAATAEPAPSPGGVLGAEQVWRFLGAALLGLPNGQRDPETLLEASLDEAFPRRLAALSDEVRTGLAQAVTQTAGTLAGRLFRAVAAGRSAVAVGLVARVLHGTREDETALRAAGRLESQFDGEVLGDAEALALADAAEAVVARLLDRRGLAAARPVVAAADALLERVGAARLGERSRFLGGAWEARLEALAAHLDAFVAGRDRALPSELVAAGERVRGHVFAEHEPARRERLDMALRLCGWLAQERGGPAAAGSLAVVAGDYRHQGGFVDWARAELWDGDPHPALGAAYTRLSGAVDAVREAANQRFGELLAGWLAAGTGSGELCGVEEVLDRCVAPLARARPVLLVLVDGMSLAVYRRLEADLVVGRGWRPLALAAADSAPAVVAALPAVTAASRASLFAGRLTLGDQATEKQGFAAHRGLCAASSAAKPPRLFHKGELTSAATLGLAREVAEAIADGGQRVVGVVVNAVDDHLLRGEQVRPEWTVHGIRPLAALLEVARAAQRVVVLASDHGHVLEQGSVRGAEGEGGERWCPATREPAPGEVLLAGRRVLLGGGRVLVPWREGLRYSGRKNGYHGGAAPQEVVVPLAAFAPAGVAVAGFEEVAEPLPSWWLLPRAAELEAPRAPAAQIELFASPASASPASSSPTVGGGSAAWIDALLACETLAQQRAQSARTPLSDERLRAILQALDERGGKLSRAALAQRLAVSPLRLDGILSALRRLLNVDGYAVVAVDEGADTVALDRRLLATQFGL